MGALLRWGNPVGGDLVRDEVTGRLLFGDELVAEVFSSLHVDAPADEGDPAPADMMRPGYWAVAFDDRAVPGSKLWMVRYVRPASRATVLAEQWARDALQHLVDKQRATSIDVTAALIKRDRIELTIVVTLPDEARRTFRLEVDYAD